MEITEWFFWMFVHNYRTMQLLAGQLAKAKCNDGWIQGWMYMYDTYGWTAFAWIMHIELCKQTGHNVYWDLTSDNQKWDQERRWSCVKPLLVSLIKKKQWLKLPWNFLFTSLVFRGRHLPYRGHTTIPGIPYFVLIQLLEWIEKSPAKKTLGALHN